MKKIPRWLKDYFSPETFNDLDIASIGEAFNDQRVRSFWILECLEEMKRINLAVDKRLLLGSEMGFTDLCARRKAYQDILESILSAKRQVIQEVRPNPKPSIVNLDRVTA